MTDNADSTTNRRSIWVRGFFMLLMIFIFQVSGTVIFVVMIIQFVLLLLNHTPNARLVSFGRSLGRYIQQIINFLTYAAEETPFPFSDWPSAEIQ
jgi:Domain of unknown function (DUF4389)